MLSNEAKALGRAIDTIQKALEGGDYESAVNICGGRVYDDTRELCARIVAVADAIKAGGLPAGGGGGSPGGFDPYCQPEPVIQAGKVLKSTGMSGVPNVRQVEWGDETGDAAFQRWMYPNSLSTSAAHAVSLDGVFAASVLFRNVSGHVTIKINNINRGQAGQPLTAMRLIRIGAVGNRPLDPVVPPDSFNITNGSGAVIYSESAYVPGSYYLLLFEDAVNSALAKVVPFGA